MSVPFIIDNVHHRVVNAPQQGDRQVEIYPGLSFPTSVI